MNLYLLAAGFLCAVVGMVHSVLGQAMIFRRTELRHALGRQWGIVWASWHVATVLSWAIAAGLIDLAWQAPAALEMQTHRAGCLWLAAGMAVSSFLVARATRARHPGWMGLLGVALLLWLGVM